MRIGGRAVTANGPQQRAGRRRANMAPRPHALLATLAGAPS